MTMINNNKIPIGDTFKQLFILFIFNIDPKIEHFTCLYQ